MVNSGHKVPFMKRILASGITKYEKKLLASRLEKHDPRYKPLHQPSGRSIKRLKKKAMARSNWYKKENNNKENLVGKNIKKCPAEKQDQKLKPSTVMIIPSTKGGTLLTGMRENEPNMSSITGFKVSYSEQGGTQLARIFSTNLGRGTPCGRDKCEPGNAPPCITRSILYESVCQICNPPNKKNLEKNNLKRTGVYYGETSRSLSERAGEHYKDAKNFSKGSHIVKHWLEKHPEENNVPPFGI